uniref:Uncharacterized protein n=1 Tax=Sipha flava TaxID=143950 RepID=A0A2S2PX74_9HEMI
MTAAAATAITIRTKRRRTRRKEMRLPPTAHPEELELWFAKTQRARARGKSREIKKLLEIPLEWFKLGGSRQPVPNYKKYFSFILFCLYTYFFFFLYMRTNRHAISRAQ